MTVSTSKNTASNLLKHQRQQHDTVTLMEIDPGKGEPFAGVCSCSPTLPKQQKLDFFSYNKSVVLLICL